MKDEMESHTIGDCDVCWPLNDRKLDDDFSECIGCANYICRSCINEIMCSKRNKVGPECGEFSSIVGEGESLSEKEMNHTYRKMLNAIGKECALGNNRYTLGRLARTIDSPAVKFIKDHDFLFKKTIFYECPNCGDILLPTADKLSYIYCNSCDGAALISDCGSLAYFDVRPEYHEQLIANSKWIFTDDEKPNTKRLVQIEVVSVRDPDHTRFSAHVGYYDPKDKTWEYANQSRVEHLPHVFVLCWHDMAPTYIDIVPIEEKKEEPATEKKDR